MCAPSPPPPPDYQGAATAQGAANRETAVAQGHINNPNVVNPYGRQTVTWDGEQPTITQTLSPEQQALLDSRTATQRQLSGLAGQGATSLQGLIGTQVDFSGAPQRARALGYKSQPNANPAARPPGLPIMGGEGMSPTGSAGNPIGRPNMPGTKSAPQSFTPNDKIFTTSSQPPAQSSTAAAPQDFGNFLNDYREQGSDYGGKPSNFTGIDPNTGQQYINGRLFAGEGNTQSGDKSIPGQAFQNVLNTYGDQIAQLTGQRPATTSPNPLPIPGGDPIPGGAPGLGQGTPGGQPAGQPPMGGSAPGGNAPGATEDPNYDIQLPDVQGVPDPLNPNGLPRMGNALNPNGLPQVGSADQVRQQVIDAMMGRTNIDMGKRQEQLDSDLIARGIRPGTEAYARERDVLERARNDARQQAEIAGGDAAQQQFGMDLSRRQEAVGEQGQQFTQQSSKRSQATGEQAQTFGQALSAGAQKFGQQGQRAQLGAQLQQQGYTQENANRRDAIAELLAQRQTPLNEISALMGGSGVSNPFTVPGYAQNTSVAPPPIFGAAQAQGQAANNTYNAQAGTYNSGLSGLASLGAAGIGAFF